MFKKVLFASALTLGFLTSFHFGRNGGAVRVDVPTKAAACDCWGWEAADNPCCLSDGICCGS
jgi:hypothetical protein